MNTSVIQNNDLTFVQFVYESGLSIQLYPLLLQVLYLLTKHFLYCISYLITWSKKGT